MKRYIVMLFIISILSSCSLAKIKSVIENADEVGSAKWDMELSVPVMKNTVSIDGFFDPPEIAPITINDIPFIDTLAPPANDLLSLTTITSPVVNIDFDGDNSSDFGLTKITSPNGDGGITITIVATVDIPPATISIGPLELDGIFYSFGSGTLGADNRTIVFQTTNFLSGANREHSLGADYTFNFDSFPITISGAPVPVLPTNTLSLTFEMNFGTDIGAEGEVFAPAVKIFELPNSSTNDATTDVPLTSAQIFITDFEIEVGLDNNMPLGIEMRNAQFVTQDESPDVIDLLDNGNPIITIPTGESQKQITTSDNIFNKGDLWLLMELYLSPGNVILDSSSMNITYDLSITAKGVVDLENFAN